MDNLQGKLLAAIPKLPDPNFFRSVVLVLKHTDEGALGTVLNRETGLEVKKVWAEVSDVECTLSGNMFLGGPVQGPLIAVHENPRLGEEVTHGLYYSIDGEQLEELISQNVSPLKLFVGHSGWGPEQLENEIDAGGWFIADAKRDQVFDSHEDLWKDVCESYGREILVSRKFHAKVPDDPSLN